MARLIGARRHRLGLWARERLRGDEFVVGVEPLRPKLVHRHAEKIGDGPIGAQARRNKRPVQRLPGKTDIPRDLGQI